MQETKLTPTEDSSKRAIEAADNVVHAYDVNLEMPETPLTPAEPSSGFPSRRHSPERGRDNLSASTGRRLAITKVRRSLLNMMLPVSLSQGKIPLP